jgi:peroxiredoxin
VQLDAEIDPKTFVVVPPEGLRKVRQFEQDYGAQPTETEPTGDDPVHGSHLVGKPAPALAGTDIDGKPFQLDDLKGKPALLFFFDVGGGQHDLLAIPIVQRFAQGHGGKLAVLGINAGNQGADVVRDVLKAKQADFRTVLDAERRLGLAFRLGGTPTFVLMDSGGVVRWAYLGTPPDLSERLDRQLSLLAESRPAG